MSLNDTKRKRNHSKVVLAPVSAMLAIAAGLMGVISPEMLPQPASAEAPFTDFNGDGYADLAIGVPAEDVGTLLNAGAVNVIYGSSSGLSATKAKTNPLWTQNSGGIADLAEAGDQFGSSLATGDFNNDGFLRTSR